MRRIYLFKVIQGENWERYVGKAPGKLLAKLCEQPVPGETQDAQRPLDSKRLTELASYIKEDGVLSTSVVLGSKNSDEVQIKRVENLGTDLSGQLYYIDVPDSDDEISCLKEKLFNIMDGQHRLFSFLDDKCELPDSVEYELTFELYDAPNTEKRMRIFKNTNEKQKPIPKGLLTYFRYQLGLPTEEEEKYYHIVELLNNEPTSPLHDRIILSAENKPRGFKTPELIKILNKISLKDKLMIDEPDSKIYDVVAAYLSAWEKAVGSKFTNRDPKFGPFSKISGLRYMLNLLPTFMDIAKQKHYKVTNQSFDVELINKIFSNDESALTPSEFFDKNSKYNKEKEDKTNYFASETTTMVLVHKHETYLLKASDNDNYKPY